MANTSRAPLGVGEELGERGWIRPICQRHQLRANDVFHGRQVAAHSRVLESVRDGWDEAGERMNRSGYGHDIEAQPVVAATGEGYLAHVRMHRTGSICDAVSG